MPHSAARDFGVQSYCFRHFKDNKQVADFTRKLGLAKIELWDGHSTFDDVDVFKRNLEIYQAAGVAIASIGVQTFVGDTARERKWFQCAKAAGAKHISAHFKVDSFQTAVPATAKLCDEFGIRVGMHCHGGYMFGGSPDILGHLMKIGGPHIGINLDTGWCAEIGKREGDPVQWVRERFPKRIFAVHYKDFTYDKTGQWHDVVIGTGNLDLPAFVKALDETGFDGPAFVECEGDAESPLGKLGECVKKLREIA